MATELVVNVTDVFPEADARVLMIRRYHGLRFNVFFEYLLETGEPTGTYEMLLITPWQRAMFRNYLVRLDAVASGETVTALSTGAL